MEPFITFIIISKRGGTISNKTLNNIKQKIKLFQAIAIMLLILVNTIALEGFIELFSRPLSMTYLNPLVITLVLGFIGGLLGLIFYYSSFIQSYIKILIGVLTTITYIILLFSVYFLFGPRACINLIIFLLKIVLLLVPLIRCLIPISPVV